MAPGTDDVSQIPSAEEFAALARRFETSNATILTLTRTVSRQNDLIGKLLRQLSSPKLSPPMAPDHILPISEPSAAWIPGDLALASPEDCPSPTDFSPIPSLPSLPSPNAGRLPLRRSHVAPSKVPPMSKEHILPAPTLRIHPIRSIKSSSTRRPTPGQKKRDKLLPVDVDSLLRSHLIWWWFSPNEKHKVPKPLREWTQERLEFKDWRKVELAARGWHIIKGHPLKEHSLDQEERPTVAELEEDLAEWRRKWGSSFHSGTNRIREHLQQQEHLYHWAPRARNRKSPQEYGGDVLIKRKKQRH